MATQGVMQWSKTAATNATADDAVNWAEGMAPSAVNNSARAEMASVAMWRDDISGTLTTGGTSTAYTLATNATFATAAEMSGAMICFIAHTASGAAPTLAVDGLTARQISSAPGVNVASGYFVQGVPYVVTYVHATTEFIVQGGATAFGALSVSSLASSGAITGTTVDGTNITASSTLTGAVAGGAMIATQATMETGASTSGLVSPGRQHFHPSAAKAWGKFAGASGTVAVSYNVTGVVRDSLGDWTVTIANDFSTADYAINISCLHSVTTFLRVVSQAAGSFTIKAQDSTGTDIDPTAIFFTCYGDL